MGKCSKNLLRSRNEQRGARSQHYFHRDAMDAEGRRALCATARGDHGIADGRLQNHGASAGPRHPAPDEVSGTDPRLGFSVLHTDSPI